MTVEQPVWESPPRPGNTGRYDWQEIADQLQDNPGRWLRVFEEGPASIPNMIRQEQVRALRPVRRDGAAGFEVRTRNNKRTIPPTCSLYLRWVAQDEEQ